MTTEQGDSAPNGEGDGVSSPGATTYSLDAAIDQVRVVEGHNPRRRFSEEKLAELAESIRAHGLLEPLVVRQADVDPKGLLSYALIAGERRLRAAKLAGLTVVPVRVVDADDVLALRLALEENLQREGLDPIEAAEGYRRLRELGMRQKQIAEAVHLSQPRIANALRLLGLPSDVQERIRTGELSAAHGEALARFADYPRVASEVARLAVLNRSSSKMLGDALPFPWELERAGAVKSLTYGMGIDSAACPLCPHYRSQAGGYCLDPGCYEQKDREAKAEKEAARAEATAAAVEQAKAEGVELPSTRQLGSDGYNYRSLAHHSPPGDCKGEACEKRIRALNEYSNVATWVCTDLRCWRKLESAATRSANKAKKADVQAKLRRIPELCAKVEEAGSRELAVIAWYALGQTSGDAREVVESAAGLKPGDHAIDPAGALAAIAGLPSAQLVRLTLEAILRYEQTERLREYTSAGTHASEFYLGGRMRERERARA